MLDKSFSAIFDKDTPTKISKSETSVDEVPNLYIQRWKKKFLNPPPQFPLDRIAFLSAKLYKCSCDAAFILQNSQLKQLVKKPGLSPLEEYELDIHPRKMINDLSGMYIHRRAALYRKRKTTIVDRKQTTVHRKRSNVVSRIIQNIPLVDSAEQILELQTTSEDLAEIKKPSIWRRFTWSIGLRDKEEDLGKQSSNEESDDSSDEEH